MVIDRLKQERLARFLLLLVLVLIGSTLIGWRRYDQPRGYIIHARMPETGGWMPDTITARVGEPLRLRLTADDMMHGFMVGQLDMEPVDIPPGKITEITLHFDEPGTYTFYCTRICSPTHWRMRGAIEVLGEETAPLPMAKPPLYVTLGADIDALHTTAVVPERRPSAARAADLNLTLPAAYQNREMYESQSPAQAWQQLRADPATAELGDAAIWDLVAFIWQSQTAPAALQTGQDLYSANCASCHGPGGAGDGPFAAMQPTAVPDLTDPAVMLGANSAILEGKILRGGMGTGMPNWGAIFTEEQIWALVDYLWTFQFPMEEALE